MAEGRSRQLWDVAANVMALVANGLLRGKGDPAFRPDQFNPHAVREKASQVPTREESKEGFRALKAIFVKPQQERR